GEDGGIVGLGGAGRWFGLGDAIDTTVAWGRLSDALLRATGGGAARTDIGHRVTIFEAGGDQGDHDRVTHRLVDRGAIDDLGVFVDGGADNLGSFTGFEQRETR